MGMKVFINPGHSPKGDPDPGAVNAAMHLAEWDIADAIGQRVRNYLDFVGCDVMLLQSDNLMGEGEGENVVRTAEAFGADVFVSIHCNAANGTARGAETLCYSLDEVSARLAALVQRQVIVAVQRIDAAFPDRGVKARPDLAVLRETSMPAALVEMAFIDSRDDAWLLATQEDEFARAIARGVTDYEQEALSKTREGKPDVLQGK
jgi:N-acetylmuramoyl-L-alanine amidase